MYLEVQIENFGVLATVGRRWKFGTLLGGAFVVEILVYPVNMMIYCY